MYKLAKLDDRGGNLEHRWRVYYYFKDPNTNKFVRFQKWISSKFKTRRARYKKAEEMIEQINDDLINGFNPFSIADVYHTSMKDAIDIYIETNKSSWRPRTLISYRSYTRRLLKWLEEKSLLELNCRHFSTRLAQDYMDWLSIQENLSPRTWNNYITGTRSMFYWFIEREYTNVNPFKKVRLKRIDEPEILSFSDYELKLIRSYLPVYNYELFIVSQLIYYCFLRPQEIVRLKVKNFDLANQLINIEGWQSKTRKRRTVTLPDILMPLIAELEWTGKAEDYVFSKNFKNGTRMIKIQRFEEMFREFAEKYGIDKKKHMYHLKHTGAGKALEAGIHIRDLQLQLGHTSLETTQVYLEKFSTKPSSKLKTLFT